MADIVLTKECARCHEVKAAEEFYKNRAMASGLTSYCKRCNSESGKVQYKRSQQRVQIRNRQRLLSTYGLTTESYNELLHAQQLCCAICGTQQSGHTNTEKLSVDHDHDTGKVRGLLCHRCNRGLGHFSDDPALLEAAIHYLRSRG